MIIYLTTASIKKGSVDLYWLIHEEILNDEKLFRIEKKIEFL